MSRATFLRHLSKNTGTTVGAFLTMMHAADLLTNRDPAVATIATIATKVGYTSESAFTTTF